MMKTLNLKKKVKGFAVSSELIFLSTIVTAGLAVGMVNVRDAVVAEMNDVSLAIGSLNQSYGFDGIINAQDTVEVAGSEFIDGVDTAAGDASGWTFVVAAGTEADATNFSATSDTGASSATEAGNRTAVPET